MLTHKGSHSSRVLMLCFYFNKSTLNWGLVGSKFSLDYIPDSAYWRKTDISAEFVRNLEEYLTLMGLFKPKKSKCSKCVWFLPRSVFLCPFFIGVLFPTHRQPCQHFCFLNITRSWKFNSPDILHSCLCMDTFWRRPQTLAISKIVFILQAVFAPWGPSACVYTVHHLSKPWPPGVFLFIVLFLENIFWLEGLGSSSGGI